MRNFVTGAMMALMVSPLMSMPSAAQPSSKEVDLYNQLDTWTNILKLVRDNYVDEVMKRS